MRLPSGEILIYVDEFLEAAVPRFAFLENHGFKRSEKDEDENAIYKTLVYRARNNVIVVAFEVREQCFDIRLCRVVGTKFDLLRVDTRYLFTGCFASDAYSRYKRRKAKKPERNWQVPPESEFPEAVMLRELDGAVEALRTKFTWILLDPVAWTPIH